MTIDTVRQDLITNDLPNWGTLTDVQKAVLISNSVFPDGTSTGELDAIMDSGARLEARRDLVRAYALVGRTVVITPDSDEIYFLGVKPDGSITPTLVNGDGAETPIPSNRAEYTRISNADQTVNGDSYIDFQDGDGNNDAVKKVGGGDDAYELRKIGRYEVTFKMNWRKNYVTFGYNARFNGALQLDSGGGFSDITETYCQALLYNSSSDEKMVTARCFIDVTVADTWEVRVRVNGDNNSNSYVDSTSALTIRYLGER